MCMKKALEALEKNIIAETGLLPRIKIYFHDFTDGNEMLFSSTIAHLKAEQLADVFGNDVVYHHSTKYQWFMVGDDITVFFKPQAETNDFLDVSVPF